VVRLASVIGGGVLGLEAAWGLKQRGMEVSVVHLMPSLMERHLDDIAAGLLRQDLDGRGIACITGTQAVALLGQEGRVSGVLLSDGRELEADLVVVAVGIRPEATLARSAGLEVGRGVLVGDDMRTSHPDIYAVGECVEHDGHCYGLVAPLPSEQPCRP
jgi:nitrite reductase (NADH) large subunit